MYVETRDSANLAKHRTAPTTDNYPALNVGGVQPEVLSLAEVCSFVKERLFVETIRNKGYILAVANEIVGIIHFCYLNSFASSNIFQ